MADEPKPATLAFFAACLSCFVLGSSVSRLLWVPADPEPRSTPPLESSSSVPLPIGNAPFEERILLEETMPRPEVHVGNPDIDSDGYLAGPAARAMAEEGLTRIVDAFDPSTFTRAEGELLDEICEEQNGAVRLRSKTGIVITPRIARLIEEYLPHYEIAMRFQHVAQELRGPLREQAVQLGRNYAAEVLDERFAEIRRELNR